MNARTKSYTYALAAILSWSTAGVAFKIALRQLDFIQVLFLSSFVSAVVLLFILIIQKKISLLRQFTSRDYAYSALLGLLNPFGYYLILFKAYSLLPAQIAQPLNYIWPLMLVLLSVPLLKQKLTRKSLFAILVSFSGVFIISAQGQVSDFQLNEPFGVMLAMGSSIVWALFWIFNIKQQKDEVVQLFLNFVFGLIYLLIPMILFSDFQFIHYSESFVAGIYIGIFEMSVAFVLWLKGLQLAESNDKISNLVYISPFLALLWIHLVLGESIYLTTIVGLSFIVAGIFIQHITFKKKR